MKTRWDFHRGGAEGGRNIGGQGRVAEAQDALRLILLGTEGHTKNLCATAPLR